MIETFDRETFEAALPCNSFTGEKMYNSLGLVDGEFTYAIRLVNRIDIMIRSSVKADGYSAGTGRDSIRVWLSKKGLPHGSKLSKYITRAPGWEARLLTQLRVFYRRGMRLGYCVKCGEVKAIFKSKKSGKLFTACPDHFATTYESYEDD